MATAKTVQELNRELADKLADEGLKNPLAAYFGKFVGIVNGKVVVVADSLDDLDRRLRKIEPDPTRCFAVEVGRDCGVVEDIWEFP